MEGTVPMSKYKRTCLEVRRQAEAARRWKRRAKQSRIEIANLRAELAAVRRDLMVLQMERGLETLGEPF